MAPTAVIEAKLQVLKHQRRRLTQTIVPDDHRIENPDMFLRQHPLGKSRVAFAFGGHAGHGNSAIGIAPYMQHRAFKNQQREGWLPAPQRLPGKHALDPGQ